MKKIIFRYKITGRISHDSDYDEYLRRCVRMSEEELMEIMTAFNEKQENLFAEIVELDDIAEFYAKRAEQHLDLPNDIAERLREIASSIDDIASVIKDITR